MPPAPLLLLLAILLLLLGRAGQKHVGLKAGDTDRVLLLNGMVACRFGGARLDILMGVPAAAAAAGAGCVWQCAELNTRRCLVWP